MFLGSEQTKTLLKSGIPLEYTVSTVLKKLDFFVTPEFRYERDEKEFSIDVTAKYISNTRTIKPDSLWLDLLIECKYNTNNPTINHKWIFFPFPGGIKYPYIVKADSIVSPFNLKKERKPVRTNYEKSLSTLFNKTTIAWKGVDLFGKECLTDTIHGGLSQLKFALIHKLMEQVEFVMPDIPNGEREYALSLILVTNNPLYIVKNPDLAKIEVGSNVELTREKWVLCYSPFDQGNREYNTKKFTEYAEAFSEDRRNLFKNIKGFSDEVYEKNRQSLLERVRININASTFVWIVDLKYLDQLLESLQGNLQKADS